MKRTHHRVFAIFLFSVWLFCFSLMQLVSFDWTNQKEYLLCLLTVVFFILQVLVVSFVQKQRLSALMMACSILYGVALMLKDLCFVLAVVRPNWHGPLALFFTCLLCDLTGFILCRRSIKRLSQKDSFNA